MCDSFSHYVFDQQGWKPEKNLRFLLQKVLKQSDVGSLGRIVLPKVIIYLAFFFVNYLQVVFCL